MTATRHALAGGGSARAFDLSDIEGVSLLLDAKALALHDGDAVPVWPDTSGHGLDASGPLMVFRNGDAANLMTGGVTGWAGSPQNPQPDHLILYAVGRFDTPYVPMPDGPFFMGYRFSHVNMDHVEIALGFQVNRMYQGIVNEDAMANNVGYGKPFVVADAGYSGSGYAVWAAGSKGHPNDQTVSLFSFIANKTADGTDLGLNGTEQYISKPYLIPISHRPGGQGNPKNLLAPADTPDSGGVGAWTSDGSLTNIPDPSRPGKRTLRMVGGSMGLPVGHIPVQGGQTYVLFGLDHPVGGSGNVTAVITWRDSSGVQIPTAGPGGHDYVGNFNNLRWGAITAPATAVAMDFYIRMEGGGSDHYDLQEIGLYAPPTWVRPLSVPTPLVDFGTPEVGGAHCSTATAPDATDGYSVIALLRQSPENIQGVGGGMGFFHAGAQNNQSLMLENASQYVRAGVSTYEQTGGLVGGYPGDHRLGGGPPLPIVVGEFEVWSVRWDQVSSRLYVGLNTDHDEAFAHGTFNEGWAHNGVQVVPGFTGDLAVLMVLNRFVPTYEANQIVTRLLERVT